MVSLEQTLDGIHTRPARLLQQSGVPNVKLKSIGIPDEFVEQGTQAALRAKYSLDASGIARQALTLLPHLDADSLLKSKKAIRSTPLD